MWLEYLQVYMCIHIRIWMCDTNTWRYGSICAYVFVFVLICVGLSMYMVWVIMYTSIFVCMGQCCLYLCKWVRVRRVYYDTNHKEAWWGNRGHRRCRSLREGACDLHRPIWMRKKAPKKKLRRRSPNPVRGLPTVFFLNFWLIWSPNQLKKKSRSPNCLFLNRLGDLFNQVGRLL